jgi:hypothetical protein
MTRLRPGLAAAALLASAAAFARPGDVVVLKGGTVIELKQPVMRRGNTAYLTRVDGTLLSVPVSEIDREATAVARAARPSPPPPAPAAEPSSPADVARATRDVPRARVRITDADVSHPLEMTSGEAADKDKKDEAVTGARVEIVDYTQEKAGGSLVVKGTLRNPTQTTADSVRLSVSAMDEKGQAIGGANATLSKGSIESGQSISFSASIALPADKNASSLRFAPQWTATPKASEAAAKPGSAPAAAAGAPAANKPPSPAPTPYGRGTLYAPPVANAPSEAPADGKTGYIPGASHPDNQPKPPVP